MLLAKLALGFCGTMVLAGTYTFHEGILRVDEDHGDGRHVHVWVPAAIVPMALHVVPRHRLERATAKARPWLPMFSALAKEVEKYPEADLVEVRDGNERVGRLRSASDAALVAGHKVSLFKRCPFLPARALEDASAVLDHGGVPAEIARSFGRIEPPRR